MEIRTGFEPATNRFAVCPLKPLEYRIMAGIAGLEPTNGGVRDRSLTAWLHPNIDVMVMPAGIEPAFPA